MPSSRPAGAGRPGGVGAQSGQRAGRGARHGGPGLQPAHGRGLLPGQGPGRHRGVAAPAGRGADAPPAGQAAMAPAPGVAAMHGFDAAPPPFQLGMPALDAFPRKQWLRLAARRLRALSPADMAYGDPAGYWPCGRRSRPICRFRAARLNRGRSSSRRAIGPVWHCWRARCWRPAIRSGWKNRVSRRLARFWSVTAAVSCRCRSMAKV